MRHVNQLQYKQVFHLKKKDFKMMEYFQSRASLSFDFLFHFIEIFQNGLQYDFAKPSKYLFIPFFEFWQHAPLLISSPWDYVIT